MKLFLYKLNEIPNKDLKYFGSKQQLFNFLNSNNERKFETELFNFDQISGVISVDNSNLFDDYNYLAVKENNFLTFYFIDNIEFLNGYVNYSVSRDEWACFNEYVSIENCYVNQSNLDFDTYGKFEKCSTISTPTFQSYPTTEITLPVAIFVVNYSVTQSSLTSSIGIGQLKMFYYAFHNAEETIEEAVEKIRKIGKIDVFENGSQNEYPCEVIKFYLLPHYLVDREEWTEKYSFDGLNNNHLFEVKPMERGKLINIPLQLDDFNYIDLLSSDVYLGTHTKGLLLPKTTKPFNVYLHSIIGESDVQVYIETGVEKVNLTSEFECIITTNSGTFTQNQKIAQGINNIGSLVSGAFQMVAGVKTGGLAGASSIIGGSSNILSSFASAFADKTPASIKESGNGILTFSYGVNWLFFKIYGPYNSNLKKFLHYGANYENLYFENFNNFKNNNLLWQNETIETPREKFVKMLCECKGVQTEFKNFMETELLNGVKFKVL